MSSNRTEFRTSSGRYTSDPSKNIPDKEKKKESEYISIEETFLNKQPTIEEIKDEKIKISKKRPAMVVKKIIYRPHQGLSFPIPSLKTFGLIAIVMIVFIMICIAASSMGIRKSKCDWICLDCTLLNWPYCSLRLCARCLLNY